MNVKELRASLAAFDDDVEVLAAAEIRMNLTGRDIEIDVPHPLEQHEIKKLHVVGHVDRETGDVEQRCVVLAFAKPELPAETISDELRQRFIKFREEYLYALDKLHTEGADGRSAASGAWEAARQAVPLSREELQVYNKLHVAIENVRHTSSSQGSHFLGLLGMLSTSATAAVNALLGSAVV
jgi:hypothetical protein